MCGICGICDATPIEDGLVDRMADRLAHRGPDDAGARAFPSGGSGPHAALGHRRLSIIDTSAAGHQPMASPDERYWLSYNGEIYNYRELRAGLEAEGRAFDSDCDSEVLLAMWERHGRAALPLLNGIYAFAVWDDRDRSMTLVRDRLGVKPLYYGTDGERLAFASEIKALLGVVPLGGLDLQALADYLTFLWVPDPRTMFASIRTLPPGHLANFRDGRMTVEQWWDYTLAPEESPEWADRLREAVTEAVQRQLVADVPLGAFLSGGVDSSAIVAAIAATGASPSTYTIGFAKADMAHEIAPDDVRYARQVAEHFGASSHEQILEPDIIDLLPKTIWHLDVPIADPAAINTYLICRAAREQNKVMMSGMGVDELFAGYPRFLAHQIAETLGRLPGPARAAFATAVSRARPGAPGRLRGLRRNAWKFARGAGEDADERYLAYGAYYSLAELHDLLSDDVVEHLRGYDPLDARREILARVRDQPAVSRFTYLEAKTFLPGLNLTYTDKMAMANSVEVRVPLLDDELVDLCGRIPAGEKLHGFRRKHVFKRSQAGVLPRNVIWRPKAGFAAPIRSWIVNELAPLVEELLNAPVLEERGLLNPGSVRRLVDRNAAGEEDSSLRVYALLNLELWMRTFLDAETPAELTLSI